MAGGIIFILALFATYAILALILTYRSIKRDEKALEERTNGDWPFVPADCVGNVAASESRGGERFKPAAIGTSHIAHDKQASSR